MMEPLPAAEVELLICCARLQLTANQLGRLEQLLAGKLDWQLLLGLADVHGLRPLLFRHLQGFAATALPRAVYAELWSRQQQLARRNQQMADELRTILGLFDERGIPSIPYKGPMLAATVYGDLALREYGDLDLLLRPRDIPGAKAVLSARAYRPEFPLPPAAEAAQLSSPANYHLALVREQPSILVELHWKTDPEFLVEGSDDRWWSELATTSLGEQKVRCFAPRELLLVLCLHGSKHFWASLGWLVDVAELIRQQPDMEWHWILARAEELQAARRLALGLHLLRKLLEVDLPDLVLAWLEKQSEAELLAEQSLKTLFDPSTPQPNAFQRLRLNFRLYETWRQRLRHTIDVVFNAGLVEWSQVSLPRPLFFLYQPMRWFRLLWKYAARPSRN